MHWILFKNITITICHQNEPEEETRSQTCGWKAHGQYHAVVLERDLTKKEEEEKHMLDHLTWKRASIITDIVCLPASFTVLTSKLSIPSSSPWEMAHK